VRITHIFETHRNEDYVVGSQDLARRTGAAIYHGSALDFGYGEPLEDNDMFNLNNIRLRILETPGHTFESISLALYDKQYGDEAVAVFTGDTLFIGDVGRTDFYPERAEEVAGLLYQSIFDKLLPLGDQAIIYPAHGAGSVCGSGMASREFSTLGYERHCNPRLHMDRVEFVHYKTHENHYQPPYFGEMERLNQKGAGALKELPRPEPLSAAHFADEIERGMVVLDTRSAEAIAGALIPDSIAIPLHMVPSFAGWYLPYDRDIGLVVPDRQQLEQTVRFLLRLGYERIIAYLEGGLPSWEVCGYSYQTIPAVHVDTLKYRIDGGQPYTLLDVRSIDEFNEAHLPDARHIYVGELPQRLGELPDARPLTTFCGSGQRALIAAALLKKYGIHDVEVCLGSMQAWRAAGYMLIENGRNGR
jgi:hydroxyacylglutathione hydrolase